MSKLQLVDAKKMEKLLFKLGFEKKRQNGSHAFYKHTDGRTTTLPFHTSKDLARPLIREILIELVQLKLNIGTSVEDSTPTEAGIRNPHL